MSYIKRHAFGGLKKKRTVKYKGASKFKGARFLTDKELEEWDKKLTEAYLKRITYSNNPFWSKLK